MDTSDITALVSGFGGVIIGAMISYYSEYRFRKADCERQMRSNFQIVLLELGRVYDDLGSLYKQLTQNLSLARAPDLIYSQVQEIVNLSVLPVSIESERIFSLADKEDDIITDILLCFRRYNSIISTISAANTKKSEITLLFQENVEGLIRSDIASIVIDLNDHEKMMALVRVENLYRDLFRHLVSDLDQIKSLIDRMNIISERKFKKPKGQYPKIEFQESVITLSYLRDMPRFELENLR